MAWNNNRKNIGYQSSWAVNRAILVRVLTMPKISNPDWSEVVHCYHSLIIWTSQQALRFTNMPKNNVTTFSTSGAHYTGQQPEEVDKNLCLILLLGSSNVIIGEFSFITSNKYQSIH